MREQFFEIMSDHEPGTTSADVQKLRELDGKLYGGDFRAQVKPAASDLHSSLRWTSFSFE